MLRELGLISMVATSLPVVAVDSQEATTIHRPARSRR